MEVLLVRVSIDGLVRMMSNSVHLHDCGGGENEGRCELLAFGYMMDGTGTGVLAFSFIEYLFV